MFKPGDKVVRTLFPNASMWSSALRLNNLSSDSVFTVVKQEGEVIALKEIRNHKFYISNFELAGSLDIKDYM